MHSHYDILILGGGASGRWLYHFLGKTFLNGEKKIGLIEQDSKKENDRTWCFWQKEPLDECLAKITKHKWDFNLHQGKAFDLYPYSYYHLPSAQFYQNIPENVASLHEEVIEVIQMDGHVEVITNINRYAADYVFTSLPAKNQKRVFNQSFCGWVLKSEEPKFNPKAIHMMDFSIEQENHTQFIYILPFSETEALVEVTRFSDSVITKEEALKIRNTYLGKDKFMEMSFESGAIPMTPAFDTKKKYFNKNQRIIPIGTSGGATKPSTGYTFLRVKQHAERIAQALKNNQALPTSYRKTRFRLYDRLLLDILQRHPNRGKEIFSCLFNKTPFPLVLKFLDEKTTIWEEIRIFTSLPKKIFLQALIRDLS